MAVLPTGIGPVTGYNIERSLRFNSADSAYLNRTPASASNRKTWTLSLWNKGGNTSANDYYFLSTGGVSTERFTFSIRGNGGALNVVQVVSGVVKLDKQTTALHRDPSAWYHFVLSVDTTQSTPAVNVYVNGVQITSFSANTNTLAQNDNTQVNNTNEHDIGKYFAGSNYFDGYLTEINFVDGQALTPSSFGLNDPETGVWSPKRYTGTYGTNGFYLNFSDNSGTTSTTLGKDSSGNGNNWTPNNFSVTAGSGNDSMVDSPTSYGTDTGAGGEVRGNYCTLNPLTTTAGTYTQGNLRYVGASAWRRSNATIPVSTGKWYWEVTLGNAPQTSRTNVSHFNAFGFGVSTTFNSNTAPESVTDAVILADNGYYKNFSGSFTDGGTAFSSGDTLSIAVDLDANTYTFRRNNTQIATGTIGGTAGRELVPIIISYNGSFGVMDCNFGQRAFAYTAPSGFKALCTQNLPTPTIGATSTTQANDYFDVSLYTGTGSSLNITGLQFQPDWVWIKGRSGATDHGLYDAVRGVQKQLESNTTTAETTETTGLTAFGTDGFTVGALAQLNTSSATYVAWNWKANGAGSSNTDGTITSTVSANTTSGFSIVTYTGNGTNGATFGHGLGVAPSMIIIKARNAVQGWLTYHKNMDATPQNGKLWLHLTNAYATDSSVWNNTAPTSTLITLGTGSECNGNTSTYVAYCWAAVPGYSAMGQYTGNGSTDGPFVYTGFRPRYVLIKRSAGDIGNWVEHDTARESYNLATTSLYPNLSNAETVAASQSIDILSNGFKLRNTSGDINASGGTYIYMALAENPFKYSLAR